MNNKGRQIHFFIPYYPNFTTGGNMYHTFVYDILRNRGEKVFVFGNEVRFGLIEKSKTMKIIYGLKNAFRIPPKSIIFLTNTAFLHFLLPLLTVSLLKRQRYIILIHHLLCEEKPKFLVSFFEMIFIKFIKNKLTVSESSKKNLIKHGIIKNGIPIVNPGLEYTPDLSLKRSKMNAIPELFFVGNIEKRKSLETVIKALSRIKKVDFILNVAGNIINVDYYNNILELIDKEKLNGKVNFLGKLSSDKLLKHYRKSDLLIFPSLWEGYGMVIAEAMANGLPVIASDIPTSKELINNGVNGFLFKKEDYEDLSQIITKLFNNPVLYSKISENSIIRALEFNTWEITATQIIDFIKNLK